MAFVSTTHCGTFCVTRDVVGRGILDAQPVGADIIRPPHGGTGLRRPHFLSKESGGKERAGRGISISPALHPPLKTTNQGGAAAPPYWMYPPSCPTGNVPAAARRAKPVQRSCSQGLQGNPDACHPRRGSACNVTVYKTGGDARLVFANQTQRTAAMSPRIGGLGSKAPGAPSMKINAKPPQNRRSPPALLSPHFFGKKWGRPPRRRAPGGAPGNRTARQGCRALRLRLRPHWAGG